MPVVNGRLTCCVCGADLGSADDPYRDPDCGRCYDREMKEELEASWWDDLNPNEPIPPDVWEEILELGEPGRWNRETRGRLRRE